MKISSLIIGILFLVLNLAAFEVNKISEFGTSNDYYNPQNGIIMGDKTIILGNRGIDLYDTSNDLLEKISDLSYNGKTTSYASNDSLIFWKNRNTIFKTNYSNPQEMDILDFADIQTGTKLFINNDYLYFSSLQSGWTFKIQKYDFNLNFITEIEYQENRCSMFRTPSGEFYNYADNDNNEYLYFYDFEEDIFTKTDSILIDYEMSEPSFASFINDSLFAVTSGISGLKMYNLNQPNQSNVVEEFPPPINSFIEYSNKLILMLDDKLEMYDISDLNNIIMLDSYQDNDLYMDICNKNDRVVVDTYKGNVLLFKIENDQFILLDSKPDPGLSITMHYHDDYLYTYTYLDGVTKWDLSNIINPVKIYSENLENAFSINLYDNEMLCQRRIFSDVGSYLNTERYIINQDGLSFPEVIPFQHSIKKHENYYYGFLNGSIHKYSYINNQFNLAETIQTNIIGEYPSIYFHNNLLICSSFNSMNVIKLNDNDAMENIAEIDLNGLEGRSFSSYNDYLFVSDKYYSFNTLIYDFADLDNIRFVGEIEQSGVLEIDAENELLFMGYYDCYVYDISDIESGIIPEVGLIPGFGNSRKLETIQNEDNNYLINLENTGCTIYEYESFVTFEDEDIDNPIVSSIQLSNHPNPFNPVTEISFELNTEITENTDIEIYNIKGQKIKSLSTPFPEQSLGTQGDTQSVIWHGTDQSGNPVASGIYFYKLNLENSPIKKMVLLK